MSTRRELPAVNSISEIAAEVAKNPVFSLMRPGCSNRNDDAYVCADVQFPRGALLRALRIVRAHRPHQETWNKAGTAK